MRLSTIARAFAPVGIVLMSLFPSAESAESPTSDPPVKPPHAQEKEDDEAADKANWNLSARTMGGKQFWTDELIHDGWRIQRNVLSRHYRLLDPTDARRAWGSWEKCRESWLTLKEQEHVPPLKKRVVVVLHGLGRTRGAMEGIAEYLAHHGDYSALCMSYASTRATIGDHAESLARVIDNLDGVEEINFLAHSMGNLVIRHYFGDRQASADSAGLDSRIRRFVMLAPPNNGTQLAERFQKNSAFRLIFGKSGQELGRDWETVEKRLATPPCPFGIIAGGAVDGSDRNPLLVGDDDMVVSVAETRLAGAADFIVVPAVHTLIMDDPRVRDFTLNFLKYGFFVSADRRQPIPAEDPRE
jgi:pimeloyl-ACP methyl ester carboxylesterase